MNNKLVKTECKRINMSSYWGDRVFASYNELVNLLGVPSSTNDDNSYNTWALVDKRDRVCSLYDWHMRIDPFTEPDENFWWNIGTHKKTTSYDMKVILNKQINQLVCS